MNLLRKLYNRLPFTSWKYGVVTKAWKEEIDRGRTGIGTIIRVWHRLYNFNGEFGNVYIVHPKSHDRLTQIIDPGPERMPLMLECAVEIL